MRIAKRNFPHECPCDALHSLDKCETTEHYRRYSPVWLSLSLGFSLYHIVKGFASGKAALDLM